MEAAACLIPKAQAAAQEKRKYDRINEIQEKCIYMPELDWDIAEAVAKKKDLESVSEPLG